MSIIRNRELSQFGSFIYVENSSQEIAITSDLLPYVGIGSTNPTEKLDVLGNVNAQGFFVEGTPLVNPVLDRWKEGTGSIIYRLDGSVGIGTSIPGQKLEVYGNVKASTFISTETTLPPLVVNSTAQVLNLNASQLGGKNPPAGSIVGTSDTQTLINKELTSPVISGVGSGVVFKGSSSGIVSLTSQPIASGVLVLPSVSGVSTLITPQSVGVITTGMIANETILADNIAIGAGITYGKLLFSSSVGAGITNSDITSNANISYSKLNLVRSITSNDIAAGAAITNGQLQNSTISGVELGNNLFSLGFDTYLTTDNGSYNGSANVTIGLNASSSDTSGSTVVVRSNGGFAAGNISVNSLNSSGIVTGTTFYIDGNQVITNTRNLINVVGGNFSGIVTANSLYVGSNQIITNTRNLINVVGGNFSGIVTANSLYVGSNQVVTNARDLINVRHGNYSGIVTTNSLYVDATQVINSSRDLINARNGNFVGIISDLSGNVRTIPQNAQTTAYILQASDVGDHIKINSAGVTVPSDVFSPGDAITIYNDSGVSRTITQGVNVTLRYSGTSSTGNRTILPYGIANILCVDTNVFVIAGIII